MLPACDTDTHANIHACCNGMYRPSQTEVPRVPVGAYFKIDRFVAAFLCEDGYYWYKVRWAPPYQARQHDTWEPAYTLRPELSKEDWTALLAPLPAPF
jgi:hypothetical protein